MLTPLATELFTALTIFTPDAPDSTEPIRVSEEDEFVVIVEPSTAMFAAFAEPMIVGPM
jgi:hypothetical protein